MPASARVGAQTGVHFISMVSPEQWSYQYILVVLPIYTFINGFTDMEPVGSYIYIATYFIASFIEL